MNPPSEPFVNQAGRQDGKTHRLNPFLWVPSLYLAMGIPFNVINGGGVTGRMYKALGYSNAQITVSVGAIGIVWSLKPLWAGFLEMNRTKKFFVLTMEIVISALLILVAASIPMPGFYRISIGLFWMAAFASSTQDICGDGIYLSSIDRRTQATLMGVQSTAWNLGKVLAAGLLIAGLDALRVNFHWSDRFMWQAVILVCAAGMAVLAFYHYFQLPEGGVSNRPANAEAVVKDFLGTAVSFFHKRAFWGMMAFVFLYRLGEGLLSIEGGLFLQSSTAQGGLGLSAGHVSNIYGLWGTIFNIVGGLLGGLFVSRIGLWRCLGVLGLCLNVPHFTFVYLSHYAAAGHGLSYGLVASMVSLEQFGYGFGFVGNMIYMMQQIAPGRSAMTHYAFATALMNLVLIPTNMISGPLAEWLGFSTYFFVVMFASIPSAWAAFKAPFPHRDDVPNEPASGEEAVQMTSDDPTRLRPEERHVQELAGRASMYAMLSAITILVLDVQILGSLQGKAAGTGQWQFGLLVVSAALKIVLSLKALQWAARSLLAAGQTGETVYAGNARGARVATWICGVVSLGILAFGAHMAF
jgi:PAT family beta-lactamase induction signal transducer AmpG